MTPAVLPPALDLVGTAIFALTGALLAARLRQTFVTMAFFALVTGVGGGSLRDMLLGAPAFWLHDPWVARALATREGQAYLWWARIPVSGVERADGVVVVTLRDLRFGRTFAPAAESWMPFTIVFRFEESSGRLLDVSW